MRRSHAALAGLAFLLAGAAAPKFLSTITLGQWEVSSGTGQAHRMCVRDPMMLVEPHDPALRCQLYTVEDAPNRATIHYTCPGHGAGRTTLVRDDNGKLQIETQGVDDGAPFNESYTAHRIGACPKPSR